MFKRIIISISGLLLLLIIVLTFPNEETTAPGKKYDLRTAKGLTDYFLDQKKIAKANNKQKPDKPDLAMQEEIALRSEIGKPMAYKQGYRIQAIAEAKAMRRPALTKSAAVEWTERGPGNFGGRTRAIVVDPTDQETWLVGAVGGGIWKTTDAGATWRAVTDDMPVLSVCAMDMCAGDPDIIYAGTGEGFYNSDAIIGDGIFKSEDRGETWANLSSTASNNTFRFVNRIIVDPADPDIVFAATNTGVYRSVNGGSNWDEEFNIAQRVQQIIANPINFKTQFITVNDSGIFKSKDGGLNWEYVSEDITDNFRIEIAMAPSDTNILYAAAENANAGLQGFYRSADAGESWTFYGNSPNWLVGQGWYDNALIVSPLDANRVYVGGIDIFRVDIDGEDMTATQLTEWYAPAAQPYVHADQHFFRIINITQDNYTIIVGNDGGIHVSPDRGTSWIEMNNNYDVTQYYDADRHPSSEDFIGGTQDNGTHRSSTDPDNISTWTQVIGGDGFDCAWHKSSPNIVYGTLYYGRVFRSLDGGYNFSLINNGLPEGTIFHTPLEMSALHSDTLYTTNGTNNLYYSYDAGSSWTASPVPYNYALVKIASSKSSPDIVWTGSTSIYTYVSTNAGQSFTQISQPIGLIHAYLTGLNTHPTLDSTAFATVGVSGYGKVFRTDDLGASWTDITHNLPDIPAFTVLVMPYDTTEIWLGTDAGLFISHNEGQTWNYADNGIPAVSIRRLKIVGQEVVATTHGRGVWTAFIDELEPAPLLGPTLADIALPNPNTGELKFNMLINSDYDSVLVYVNGQVSDRLYNLPAGIDTFSTYLTSPPELVEAQAYGFKDAQFAASELKSTNIYAAEETLTENFNDLNTTFFGDFSSSTPTGFDNALLNSEHPYSNSMDHIAYLGTPILIQPGATLSYDDIAIVEPGEPGYFYPDPYMWDYVTVEGSNDGETWQILTTPYDCRSNTEWENAYYDGVNGEATMLVSHEVDLTLNYPINQKIYLRFRLHADEAVNSWGWAIDNVGVSNIISSMAAKDPVLNKFYLYNNYPNPFNPETMIGFTLSENAPVYLTVYNYLGQRIKSLYNGEVFESGKIHHTTWDGKNESGQPAASGTYFYKLNTGQHQSIKKMVLLR